MVVADDRTAPLVRDETREALVEQREQYARGRLAGNPPEVRAPIGFVQRMTFETELLAFVDEIRAIFLRWGYTYSWDARTYFWFLYNAEFFLVTLSSQSSGTPSLYSRWQAIESQVEFIRRPMVMMEMALNEANKLGLTLRAKDRAFAPLPREKILAGLDPSRTLEEPETIGVLQLAGIVAESARRRRDCFIVIDAASTADVQFGAGKSQLMVEVLDEAYRNLGKKFDLRHDLVYADDHSRFDRLLDDRTPLSPFGVDELDQFAYAREAMRGDNKGTMQALKRVRKFGRPIVGCTGSLWQLDPFLRDVKITHRVRIENWDEERFTGRAVVFRKGGFSAQPDDDWGRFLFRLNFEGLPKETYDLYFACASCGEETSHAGGMDKFLSKNPDWLLPAKSVEIPAESAKIPGQP